MSNHYNESIVRLAEQLCALDVNNFICRVQIVCLQGSIKGLINARDNAAKSPKVFDCGHTTDDDVICRDCGEHSDTEACKECGEEFGTSCCGAKGRF